MSNKTEKTPDRIGWIPDDEALNYTIEDLFNTMMSNEATIENIMPLEHNTVAEIESHCGFYAERITGDQSFILYTRSDSKQRLDSIFLFHFYPECYYCRAYPYFVNGELDDSSDKIASLLHFTNKLSEIHLIDVSDSFNKAIMHYFMNLVHWWKHQKDV